MDAFTIYIIMQATTLVNGLGLLGLLCIVASGAVCLYFGDGSQHEHPTRKMAARFFVGGAIALCVSFILPNTQTLVAMYAFPEVVSAAQTLSANDQLAGIGQKSMDLIEKMLDQHLVEGSE